MSADPKASAAAHFVRILNILPEVARLVRIGHVLTAAQFEDHLEKLRCS